MEDLKNKKPLKLLWLPGEQEFLYQMTKEVPLPIQSAIYTKAFHSFDIGKWLEEYSQKYYDWLNNDDNTLYDIHNEINSKIINALKEINSTLQDELIFYWFDVDRTENEAFIWEYCPISSKKLISLGDNFSKLNSLISPDYPLVFPSG